MGAKTNIEWTDATWEPIIGCTAVSPGCNFCYAAELVGRRLGRNPATPRYHGLAVINEHSDLAKWSGRAVPQPDHLDVPLHWRSPKRVFVCSRSDLFHEDVRFEYIAAVFGVMATCQQHTFLVLTKRPERARYFYAWLAGRALDLERPGVHIAWTSAVEHVPAMRIYGSSRWPLPNVHVGVSVEDQERAEERIPVLLEIPAAKRWISLEPQLGDVDLSAWLPEQAELGFVGPELRAKGFTEGPILLRRGEKLDQVIVGGESGKRARENKVEWTRKVVEQCTESQTAVFVKQLGAVVTLDGERLPLKHKKGADVPEWHRLGLGDLDRREFCA